LANVDVKTLLVEEIYHLADINTKTKITWKKDCWMLAASVISECVRIRSQPNSAQTDM
jgi:hypothetical protein